MCCSKVLTYSYLHIYIEKRISALLQVFFLKHIGMGWDGKVGKKRRKEKKKNILGVSHFWFVVGNEGEFILFFFFFFFPNGGLIVWMGKGREKEERTIKK